MHVCERASEKNSSQAGVIADRPVTELQWLPDCLSMD